MIHRARTIGCLIVALVMAAGCRTSERGAADSAKPADWSGFEGADTKAQPEGVRVVPETPIEITGVPYIRSIQLAWTKSEIVPSYEPENQTLKVPSGARQAVLLVDVVDLPDASHIRVEWFYGKSQVFSDSLSSRDDGDHYFALVMRDGKRIEPLPAGEYHADVLDGQRLVKSVRFQVVP